MSAGCNRLRRIKFSSFLGLKPLKFLPAWAARGFTVYPEGHSYGNRFQLLIGDGINLRLIPIDDKVVYFNAIQSRPSKECTLGRDAELVQQATLQAMRGFPEEARDLVRRCDTASLSFTQLSYRPPWYMVLEPFRQGTVAVAGDAMHAMAPFLGQGGSCGLEDAVVLARCLAETMRDDEHEGIGGAGDDDRRLTSKSGIEDGLARYVKERRWRILMLCVQTFLMGVPIAASSGFEKVLATAVMTVLFRNKYRHTEYDSGLL